MLGRALGCCSRTSHHTAHTHSFFQKMENKKSAKSKGSAIGVSLLPLFCNFRPATPRLQACPACPTPPPSKFNQPIHYSGLLPFSLHAVATIASPSAVQQETGLRAATCCCSVYTKAATKKKSATNLKPARDIFCNFLSPSTMQCCCRALYKYQQH